MDIQTSSSNYSYSTSQIKKMTFINDTLNVFLFSGTTDKYPLSNILRHTFETSVGYTSMLSSETTFVCYPNPTNDEINIDFSLENAADLTISIYDLTGCEVGSIKEVNYSEGKHSIKFNLLEFGDITNGAFILRIIDNSGSCLFSNNLILKN
jgi:hypothetical protein